MELPTEKGETGLQNKQKPTNGPTSQFLNYNQIDYLNNVLVKLYMVDNISSSNILYGTTYTN